MEDNKCELCGVDRDSEGRHPWDECMISRSNELALKASEASYDKYMNRKHRIKEKSQTEWE